MESLKEKLQLIIEDYKRREQSANEFLRTRKFNGSIADNATKERMMTKAAEYRTMAAELERLLTPEIPTTKEEKIVALTSELIDSNASIMKEQVKRAVKSGAIDVEGWVANSMIIPNALLGAALEHNAHHTLSLSKAVKKEVKNLRHFL
jgi:hypothetical protein